jgi:hypothetical protein
MQDPCHSLLHPAPWWWSTASSIQSYVRQYWRPTKHSHSKAQPCCWRNMHSYRAQGPGVYTRARSGGQSKPWGPQVKSSGIEAAPRAGTLRACRHPVPLQVAYNTYIMFDRHSPCAFEACKQRLSQPDAEQGPGSVRIDPHNQPGEMVPADLTKHRYNHRIDEPPHRHTRHSQNQTEVTTFSSPGSESASFRTS